jgi:hypothetical protein
MLGSQVVRSASLLAGLAVSVVGADLPAISVIGSKFFDSNGDQFFVKGRILAELVLPVSNHGVLELC